MLSQFGLATANYAIIVLDNDMVLNIYRPIVLYIHINTTHDWYDKSFNSVFCA